MPVYQIIKLLFKILSSFAQDIMVVNDFTCYMRFFIFFYQVISALHLHSAYLSSFVFIMTSMYNDDFSTCIITLGNQQTWNSQLKSINCNA